ncbi:prepilin-type N-terminal cleavage/methylation domain-containing protein [Thermodesulfobacterium commune]|uniref:prepilin-type N-terminal cleavage/methylation domain-containing protein n=1 Tax=Thermodesulfobacterium commune TaxID=1741 RepID=UPI002FD89D99
MSRGKGFTLIELLIVVAIIAILAAIAIPQFQKYRKNAAVAACQADLRNAMTQCAAYLAEHPETQNMAACQKKAADILRSTTYVDVTFGNDAATGTCKGPAKGVTCTIAANGTMTCS